MKNRYSWQVTILPIIFIIFTAVVLSFLNIYELQLEKENQIDKVTTEFIEQQKLMVKDRVMMTSELIWFQHSQTRDLVRKRVKDRVDEAVHIGNVFYETYKDDMPEKQLKEQLKVILSNAVFDHPDGYFFAVDMATEKIIIHKLDRMIGYSMSQHKDLRGLQVLSEQKELLSESDGAFQIIYFSKPTDPTAEFPKQLYIRYFKPYNWLIGTGEYLDDMEKRLQKTVLEQLEKMYKGDEEDLFITQDHNRIAGDGKPYASIVFARNPINKPGQTLYDTEQDSRGNYFRKEVLKLLREEGEGFVSYYYPSPIDGLEVKKTSFFYYDETWKWTIGSGFYYNSLEEELSLIEEDINGKIRKEIKTTLMVSLLIILIMSVVFLVISKSIARTISSYAEKLEQSQKMDALGQLAGGMAHDFNNVLSGILNASQLLQLPKQGLNEKSLKYVDMIIQASIRASELISKLLVFSRKGKFVTKNLDMHDVLNDTAEILRGTIDKKISISVIENASNNKFIGDFSSIESAFLNLGINSSHAMPDGGIIEFKTKNIYLDQSYCDSSSFNITAGEFLQIGVKDNGSGISKENLQKIFEPFFTTKEQGKGTGLGLSAVYGTIQDHHGVIEVHSEVGIGTTLLILLPCTTEPIKQENEESLIKPGSGIILVVDDEEMNRNLNKEIFESFGYNVLLAKDGMDAIEIFRKKHTEIDIVFMDMIMPKMNGSEAFHKMKEIDENCKVIISSGYTRDESIDKLIKNGLSGFINKPYSISEINQVLDEVQKG